MKLIWLERALVDQDNILDYITERDDEAAENLHAAIDACSRRIEQHPFMYRPGRATGTREAVVHPNYILIYRVTGEAVEIIRLVHARQEYP